jgi:hypothetical protein
MLSVFLVSATIDTPANATGYWNLPSSIYQSMGYGCGAGYHAPLLLGPRSCAGWFATNERRLPYAPAPPHAGCNYGDSCQFAAPTMLEPARFVPAQQPMEPAPQPASRTQRPLFLP